MNHIWAVEEFWYATITQTAMSANRFAARDLNAEEIFEGLINQSTLLADTIKSFTEAELTEKIKLVSPWLEANQSRYEYLQQTVNHATYHRGQIITISRNAGITGAPNTDYIFFCVAKEQVEA